MSVAAVVFDLDGTLYPYRRIIFRSVPLALRNLRFFRAFARARRAVRMIRPVQNLHVAQAELVATSLGLDASHARAMVEQVVYDLWVELFKGLQPCPGVLGVLDQLRRRGLRLAVLSDLPVERRLILMGMDSCWDCAVTSETTNYLKPSPEPFEYVAAQLEVPTTSILFVGNNHAYDIVGARNLGMRTAHFSRRPARNSVADVTFSRYPGFIQAIEPLLV